MRAIQARPGTPPEPGDPSWLTRFLASLAREDLSPATLRGYRYDLRHFLRWHRGITEAPFAPDRLAEYDLITYRQQMIAAGRRPATINRRLEALRRLGRWAHSTGGSRRRCGPRHSACTHGARPSAGRAEQS